MHYISKPLQEFLHTYTLPNPTTQSLNTFKEHLDHFLAQCHKHTAQDTSESEEFQKNLIADFLKQAFSYPKINTKHKIDLAIYEDDEVKTFFEVKSIANKSEFPKSTQSLDSKALYEALLYYMREQNEGNNNLKCILLCNVESFYLISAKEFEKLSQNKELQKAYKNVDKKQGNDTSTKKFYQKAQEILSTLDMEMTFTHFGIKDTEPVLLYQVFSPHLLLGYKTHIDSNVLNQNFYEELLYILGLEETKDGANKLIKLSDTPNTLSYAIRENLGLDCVRDFESIFELIITWNNRLLFLRLLESMLLSFKHIPKPFLDSSVIESFAKLNTLFFEILALRENVRKSIPKELDSIPYLNSSLFDKTELEKQGKEIKLLDSKPLALYKKSILKDTKKPLPLLEYLFDFLNAYDFTTTPKDIQDNVKINHDKLINAAVLGLVFEKLNGYKEGSFYTPSFITNYMCKQSLQQVVIQKFNTAKNWDCKDLQSLKLRLDKLTDSPDGYKEANEIFDSIKVCDPSVGSGHFLVSMLNNMIELKFHLKILCDENFERLKDIQLRLENDEIVLQDSTGNPHIYQIPSHQNIESHKLQKAIFHNKRTLIESCLFGVDINHNSCEITKLRLWIELLKYSYYIFENGKNTNTLQTLPNIDINIKCGNSLVSNIALDMTKESLEKDLKNRLNSNATLEFANEILSTINDIQNKLPNTIQSYKDAVNAYKNETNAELKSLHKQQIQDTQKFIISIFHKTSKAYQDFKNTLSSYLQCYGYNGIDNATLQGKSLDSALKTTLNEYIIAFNFHKSLDIPKEPKGFVEKELITLIDSMQEYENLTHDTNTFEWRFAFPEVLDNNGDFLGFDLVIGNPPYIRQEEIKHLKPHLKKAFSIYKGTSDIYTYFFEQGYKILKPKALLSFITSNKYTRAGYGEPLRAFILANTQILHYIDLNGLKIFDSATVDTSIITFAKTPPSQDSFDYLAPTQPSLDTDELHAQPLHQSSLSKDSFIFQDQANQALKAKIESLGTPLKEWDISINYGIKTGYNEAFIIDSAKREEILNNCKDKSEKTRTSKLIKKMLRGRDIKRYGYEWAGLWLINTHNGYQDSKGNKIPPIDIKDYPTLKAYFDEIGKNHKGKGKGLFDREDQGITPYNLRNCAYLEEFEKEKIVWAEMTNAPSFIYDNNSFFINQTCYFLIHEHNKYLLGILNSNLIHNYMKSISSNLGDGAFRWIKQYIEKLPIPKIDSTNKALSDEIISLVEQILDSKAKDPTKDTKELESHIDSLVYKLYNLNEKEIKLLKGIND
ncbi:TaqI-like C-terminal specificity domain-containing protein [Helicobacter sp. 11-8110]|uniref:type IIG restriction enzyme/methyltransferase n=1 Tax=Helicobacter sp. 11-8110 TaxID=2004997 RepID=UPI000DCF59E3|nr:TaqI-like C-terminal specificity domain-containing protein [Helicobacter sp. 11-8110]RAX53442.1 type II restriction endonuclease [Helicobacter sp. 11-8110]